MTAVDCIRHPLLERIGVAHGFGTRDSAVPPRAVRPIQVHGVEVFYVDANSEGDKVEADAVVCARPGSSIAIATADCVPILACSEDGKTVAAIHAGWRGLAKGVVEAGIEALRGVSSPGDGVCAVIGPHIGACCYEIDEPVLEAMSERFGSVAVARASQSTGPGHARLSLADLAEVALDRAGVASQLRGRLEQSCTSCDGERFHSFRRDGQRAGRMVHFISTI